MNKRKFVILAGAFLVFGTTVRGQTGAQASGQASTQTNAQVGGQKAEAGASSNSSASATTKPGQANASLASGTAVNAQLKSPVDAKKNKPGDEVSAQTTEAVKSGGKVVLPKGTKLIGHVAQASAKGKGDAESALAIQFDKAILKNGQEMPLNVTIQAIASAQSAASAAGADIDSFGSAGASATGGAARSGGGALGGVASTAGATAGAVANTAASVGGNATGAVGSTVGTAAGVGGSSAGAIGGLNAAGQLASNSRGVFGLSGLNLNSAASSATQGSVITSAGKNVHLDSGTRLLLVSQAAASAQ